MSRVANGAAHSSHESTLKIAPAFDSHLLSVKNVKGVKETIRVAWIVRDTRGVVAVEDIISAVRGLSHEEAATVFRQQREDWQRSQSLEFERIVLPPVNGYSSNQDVEVCTLEDLPKIMDAIAAVQGQPEGVDDVCSRLERSLHEWARIRLQQRLRELSNDQANIHAALQSVFTVRESQKPNSAAAPTATNASNTSSPAVTAVPSSAALPANRSSSGSSITAPTSNAAPTTSSHSSPYIGPASGVAAPPSGQFWLYDPAPAPTPPASRGGGLTLSATTAATVIATIAATAPLSGTANSGSPLLSPKLTGILGGHNGSQHAAAATAHTASSAGGSAGGAGQMGQVEVKTQNVSFP